MTRPILWLLTAAFLMACGAEGTTPPPQEDTRIDIPEFPTEVDAWSPPETLPDTAKPDGGDDVGTDIPTDLGDGAQTNLGFMSPCEEDEQCLSGLCIPSSAGLVCTIGCASEDDCDEPGWSCRQVQIGANPDPVIVCVQMAARLCHPCNKDDDCEATYGDADNRCLPYGPLGSYCGYGCDEGSDCPPGYGCQEVTLSSGEALFQCVPQEGDCPCKSDILGEAAECFYQNEWGTCTGARVCSAEGWEPCTAKLPAAETCNGVDDDCDGSIDEFEDLGETECGQGPCRHTVKNCVDGVAQSCDPFEGADTERCNGVDDDCDGFTDEEWPQLGTPCDGPDSDACEKGYLSCDELGGDLVCADDKDNEVELCDGQDNDCDLDIDEVEDLGTTTCGLGICAHTVHNCVDGAPTTCDPTEGAEAEDDPDPAFLDANCDGQDGDLELAIFVDIQSGSDANDGTPDAPVATIAAGLQRAQLQGKPHVYVSKGIYGEQVVLQQGLKLFGKFDHETGWTRSHTNVTEIHGGTSSCDKSLAVLR